MLDIVDLSKSYHGVPAVRMLTLSATPGHVVGLLGPNGSGKSTTVRMMVGLIKPTAGHIKWRGVDIRDQLLAYQSVIGYVPEEPRLYPYLTAPQYLELVGGLRDIDRRTLARRIDKYLELFGLQSDIHTALSAFSKGMRQKVLISAALLHDPEIVILDEPCSGLDVASTLILRRLVSSLASRGKTVIYSSHVMDMVERVCDDVVILHRSHVVAHNTVDRLREVANAASLEQAFATIAVDQDVDRIGTELAAVGAL